MIYNNSLDNLISSNLTVNDLLFRNINRTRDYYDKFLENSKQTFLITILISSGPFLCLVILILILSAILRKIFSWRKTYRRKQNVKHIKLLENYLALITESKETSIKEEREKAFVQYALKSRTNIKSQVIPISYVKKKEKKMFCQAQQPGPSTGHHDFEMKKSQLASMPSLNDEPVTIHKNFEETSTKTNSQSSITQIVNESSVTKH